MNYHRIDYPESRPWLGGNVISTSPEEFSKQMELIASHYHPVSAQDVVHAVINRESLPDNAVLITVDDGYLDFKEFIHPVTLRLGIRPVLFVATHYVGKNIFWWDKLYHIVFLEERDEILSPAGNNLPLRQKTEKEYALAELSALLKRMPFDQAIQWIDANFIPEQEIPPYTLSWDELRHLHRDGVTIAAHSHTHPILTQVTLSTARQEIRTSQDLIKNEIGEALPIFAFPDGKPYAVNDKLIQILKEEGFQVAFTTTEGRADLNCDDPLRLPRIGIWEKLHLGRFHFHMTPVYDRRIRKRIRG